MTSVCATGFRDPLDPCGTIFVNCPFLWFTCSIRHLGHSSLIMGQVCAPSAKIVSGTSCMLIDEDVTMYQERRAKLPTEDVTTRRERLASHLKKMLQRIRNVLQVT